MNKSVTVGALVGVVAAIAFSVAAEWGFSRSAAAEARIPAVAGQDALAETSTCREPPAPLHQWWPDEDV